MLIISKCETLEVSFRYDIFSCVKHIISSLCWMDECIQYNQSVCVWVCLCGGAGGCVWVDGFVCLQNLFHTNCPVARCMYLHLIIICNFYEKNSSLIFNNLESFYS